MAPKTEAKGNADQNQGLAEKKQPRVDLYGEPLPQGAIARMGTIQFRHPPSNSPVKLYLAEAPATGVAFSPDGQVIATHCWEWLRLWNANTGKLLFEIKDSDLPMCDGPVFSPDGRFLAAALARQDPNKGQEAYACLWDAKTGKLCHRFPPRSGLGPYVRHILFSPDSKLFAMTHESGTIHLWSTDTGKEVAVLPSKSSYRAICSIAFSTDGKTLVTVPYQPRRIWHWDVAKGEVHKVVSLEILDATKEIEEGKTGTYGTYMLSKDGRTLACQFFGDPIVRLLDTSTGKVRCHIKAQLTELIAQFTWIAFAPDGRFLALAEFAGYDERKLNVSLWDTETGKLNHRFKVPAERFSPLTFSPDGSRVTIGRYYIRLYDVASGNELLSKPAHEGPASSLAFTPDGSTLISGGQDGMIGIWDAATGKGRHFNEANRWRGGVTGVALVPGGSTFVSCGMDGIIRLHDWRTGKEIRRFEEKPLRDGVRARGLYDHYQFKEVRISGDRRTVIGNVYTGQKEAPFHSWDMATGKLLQNFPKQGDAEFSDLGADGKHFIGFKYLTPDHSAYTVEVREIAGGRQLFILREIDSNAGHLPCSLLTADSRLLIHATAHNQQPTIRLWEMATGKERLSIVSNEEGWDCYYDSIALSPDGRVLATARHDNTLQLWDLITGKELMERSDYTEPVSTMAFSADGKSLATGHGDGILVWDVSLPERKPSQVARSAKELDSWWKDLAGEDAARAHAAISNLVEVPEQAVGLFQGRLRPAKDRSERIARLIARLDDDRFGAREAASKELETLGSEADPAVRRALDQQISSEQRRRIEKLLALRMRVHDPELLQGIRAIEVLEYIATPGAGATRLAAIDLLKRLAGGPPEARLTQEAKAALRRL